MEDDRRVLELLRAHGHHATSFQILEPGFSYWFWPEASDASQPRAVIAYVDVSGYRIVAGHPIAEPEDIGEVARRFSAECRREGRRVAFFAVESAFVDALAAAGVPHDAIQIAEQPEWRPADYHVDGPRRRSLRAQVRRAARKGVVVRRVSSREVVEEPGPLRAAIDDVLRRWLSARRMSVMRFLVDLQPFTHPKERRYYVAECGDRAVGFLAAIPIYRRGGWFFEDVIRTPDAPNGTVELLIHTAMEDARDRGDGYATLGMAPLAGVTVEAGPHRLLRRALRACYEHLGPLYHFPGLRAFKARFHPDEWVPQYLVVIPPRVGPRALHAVLRAFAGGGLLAFGADTVRRWLARAPTRRWATGLEILAALLVPWTVLLAVADGSHWFGSVGVQRAWLAFDWLAFDWLAFDWLAFDWLAFDWLAFDTAMVLGFVGLARLVGRESPAVRPLGFMLAGATMTDFVLTAVQALHLGGEIAGRAAFIVAAGMAGPLVATVFLLALAATRPVSRPNANDPRGHDS